MNSVVKSTLNAHYRIVFNGDGYSADWRAEAEKRGLPNFRTTPDALQVLSSEKNLALFENLRVMVRNEVISRQHVLYEIYNKTITIEAKSLLTIASTSILPAAMSYQKRVADIVSSVSLPVPQQKKHLETVVQLVESLLQSVDQLQEAVANHTDEDEQKHAFHLLQKVVPLMLEVRTTCDKLEQVVDDDVWPLPKYSEILFFR